MAPLRELAGPQTGDRCADLVPVVLPAPQDPLEARQELLGVAGVMARPAQSLDQIGLPRDPGPAFGEVALGLREVVELGGEVQHGGFPRE